MKKGIIVVMFSIIGFIFVVNRMIENDPRMVFYLGLYILFGFFIGLWAIADEAKPEEKENPIDGD